MYVCTCTYVYDAITSCCVTTVTMCNVTIVTAISTVYKTRTYTGLHLLVQVESFVAVLFQTRSVPALVKLLWLCQGIMADKENFPSTPTVKLKFISKDSWRLMVHSLDSQDLMTEVHF